MELTGRPGGLVAGIRSNPAWRLAARDFRRHPSCSSRRSARSRIVPEWRPRMESIPTWFATTSLGSGPGQSRDIATSVAGMFQIETPAAHVLISQPPARSFSSRARAGRQRSVRMTTAARGLTAGLPKTTLTRIMTRGSCHTTRIGSYQANNGSTVESCKVPHSSRCTRNMAFPVGNPFLPCSVGEEGRVTNAGWRSAARDRLAGEYAGTEIWRRFQHFCSAMISNEWHDFD